MGDVVAFDKEMRDGAKDLVKLAEECQLGEAKGVAYVFIRKDGSVNTNVFFSNVGQLAMMGAIQVLVDDAGQMDDVVDNDEKV